MPALTGRDFKGKRRECEFCQHFKFEMGDGFHGICRVRSPSGEAWPRRYKNDGCGEWRLAFKEEWEK